MSPSPDDSIGAVFATDLHREALKNVRIVVLAACDTASGRVSRGEGVFGLARAFLRAGASAVVASLWPIDDARSVELAVTLHKELRAGYSVSDALRRAQLRVQASGHSDPADWAALITLGRDVRVSDARQRSMRR